MSHELRAPIGIAIFFLARVMKIIEGMISLDPQVSYYLNLVHSQINFMQSFVDDLLDYRQLKDGVFSLTNALFDPNETIKLILDIFKP